jgi:hypothetical protein
MALAVGDLRQADKLARLADDLSTIEREDPFPPSWKPSRSEIGLYYRVQREDDREVGIILCERCVRVPLEEVAMRAARVRPMRRLDFAYSVSPSPVCGQCGWRPLDG